MRGQFGLRAQRVTELLLELIVELFEGEALVLGARVFDLQGAIRLAMRPMVSQS
ncbi:MAG: hypothetical protein GAK31_02337 [Stenotrophomonas maltophilia]|uniref:Uncharacterized protein n=1 Tax=Stenotrophomonas maltophilia TaxID=40324 RepID=A0A7V8FG34_STEMA|nr:MAG: hypothetical protein GAK31_02337 [Stenotrophomonas maltophilia]